MTKTTKKLVEGTGEVLEFDISTPEKMVEVWAMISEYEKAYKYIKEDIKKAMEPHLNANNTFEYGNYLFRLSNVQRYTFDKSLMKEVMDEDEVDLFLKPDPTKLKKYITEDIKKGSSRDWAVLTKNMIPDGKPYPVFKQEKLSGTGRR